MSGHEGERMQIYYKEYYICFSRLNRSPAHSVVCANVRAFRSVITFRGLKKFLSVKIWKLHCQPKPDRLCSYCSVCQSIPFLETSFSPTCLTIKACGRPNATLVTISAPLLGTKNPLVNSSAPLVWPKGKMNNHIHPACESCPPFLPHFSLRTIVHGCGIKYVPLWLAHFSLTKLYAAYSWYS